jgi:hypothetical protein
LSAKNQELNLLIAHQRTAKTANIPRFTKTTKSAFTIDFITLLHISKLTGNLPAIPEKGPL